MPRRTRTVAEQFIEVVKQAGVQRIYGLVGDSLNPVVDAVRRNDGIEWVHVHNEEAAAFAAGAEAQLTGRLAVCAGQLPAPATSISSRASMTLTAPGRRCWRSPRTSRALRSGPASSRRRIRSSCSPSAATTAS